MAVMGLPSLPDQDPLPFLPKGSLRGTRAGPLHADLSAAEGHGVWADRWGDATQRGFLRKHAAPKTLTLTLNLNLNPKHAERKQPTPNPPRYI